MSNVAQNREARPELRTLPADPEFLELLKDTLVGGNQPTMGMIDMLAQDLELLSRIAERYEAMNEGSEGYSDDYFSFALHRASKRVRLIGELYEREMLRARGIEVCTSAAAEE